MAATILVPANYGLANQELRIVLDVRNSTPEMKLFSYFGSTLVKSYITTPGPNKGLAAPTCQAYVHAN